jgi:hypothetical protein
MMSARELELPKYNSKHNVQGETTIYKQPTKVKYHVESPASTSPKVHA